MRIFIRTWGGSRCWGGDCRFDQWSSRLKFITAWRTSAWKCDYYASTNGRQFHHAMCSRKS